MRKGGEMDEFSAPADQSDSAHGGGLSGSGRPKNELVSISSTFYAKL